MEHAIQPALQIRKSLERTCLAELDVASIRETKAFGSMKILHLNTYDLAGGAARAAHRLHNGLSCLGLDSSMFVSQVSSNDATVVTFEPTMGLWGRLCRRFRREQIEHSFARYRKSLPVGYESFRTDRSKYGADLVRQLPHCEVINLHWVINFVDYQAFFSAIPYKKPIVWTLHDMNPFTGGCHYDDGCGKYTDGCGACPQLGSNQVKDLSYRIWQRKREIFNHIPEGRLHLVSPSRWLAGETQRSALFGRFPVSVIPNGVDLDDFAPRDRFFARNVLGVPQNANVILFCADWVGNRRKGLSQLAQALGGLGKVNHPFLISLGSGISPLDIPIPHLHLGPIHNDRFLSLVYSAADLFVISSLQDNLPNTVLEAMACGTPVIGFAVGGIPDMVRPGITGLLVPPCDVVSLRAAILGLVQDEKKRREMSANCRRIAVEEYSLELQARRYSELYKSLL
jgi:glycosyltransferase involved in cell wall biosynthesis